MCLAGGACGERFPLSFFAYSAHTDDYTRAHKSQVTSEELRHAFRMGAGGRSTRTPLALPSGRPHTSRSHSSAGLARAGPQLARPHTRPGSPGTPTPQNTCAQTRG
eukprot:6940664-Prymnesium_polylepis.2